MNICSNPIVSTTEHGEIYIVVAIYQILLEVVEVLWDYILWSLGWYPKMHRMLHKEGDLSMDGSMVLCCHDHQWLEPKRAHSNGAVCVNGVINGCPGSIGPYTTLFPRHIMELSFLL